MKFKKALKVIGNVLSGALVVIEIALIAFVLVSKLSGQMPTVFGYQMFQVVTPSMEPEIMVGDIIVSKEYDGGELEIGDVITYNGRTGELAGKRITHEIIEIDGNQITTKGIANQSPDATITKKDVIGVMIYKTVILDKIYKVISSTAGFVFLLVVPLVIMIISEFRELIKQIRKEAEVNDEEKSNASTGIAKDGEN